MSVGFFESLYNYRSAILIGLSNTVLSALLAIVFATVLGLLIGFVLTFGNRYVKIPFRLYVDVVRGIPGLVVVFSVYYFLDFFLRSYGVKLPAISAGVIALSITASAQVAELTRGSLQSLHKGQIEAGRAIGLRFHQILCYILLPQAVIQMVPPWINTATETVKGSTLLALIGVSELLLVTQQMIATNNQALKYYIFVGVLFFLLNTVIELVGRSVEKRLRY